MKFMLIKTAKGLRGATADDHAAWLKFRRRLENLKPGSWLRTEFTRPREIWSHNRFWALVALITENSEVYDTKPKALVAIKLVTGYFDLMVDPQTGEVVKIPKSISFDEMDQEAFEVFYPLAIDGILRHILPQLDRHQAEYLLDMIIEGWA
jgi:hypothetical protein